MLGISAPERKQKTHVDGQRIVATGKNEQWHQPGKGEVRENSTRPEERRMAAQITSSCGRWCRLGRYVPTAGGKLGGKGWWCCWERWRRQWIADGEVDEGGIGLQGKERVIWREAIEERNRGWAIVHPDRKKGEHKHTYIPTYTLPLSLVV